MADAGSAETARIDVLWPEPQDDVSDDELLARYGREDRGIPWLRVNFISSVDGAASANGLSAGLGVPADRRVFDLLRRLTDVVIVGAGTVRAEGYGPMRLDPPQVKWRVDAGLSEHPVFAIVSGRLDLDPASPIFTDAPVRPIVITTNASPVDKREALAAVADVLVCGEDSLDVVAVRRQLAERGLTQQHCEGGPSLFASFIAADAVDELCLTVSPVLEAGDSGRISSGTKSAPRGLALGHVLRSEAALLLRYVRAE